MHSLDQNCFSRSWREKKLTQFSPSKDKSSDISWMHTVVILKGPVQPLWKKQQLENYFFLTAAGRTYNLLSVRFDSYSATSCTVFLNNYASNSTVMNYWKGGIWRSFSGLKVIYWLLSSKLNIYIEPQKLDATWHILACLEWNIYKHFSKFSYITPTDDMSFAQQ